MKTKKRKLVLPLMAFLFAIAAAFATQENHEEDTALVPGYIRVNNVCQPAQECSTVFGEICTYQGKPVFGMTGSSDCNLPLYFPKK
ncbi:DUF6520 family protein [Marixanthomonas ophiurae]|uniref:Uncharacterized protein n=1 Tax=Marixanthomonas ophiurae TaxID=387659 RepID=A0A3E1QE12_9FLAO|nr:DUF6520 family protein [Marixanthomonas ophiurae]RFN60334.1 hypothetical protein DZ858_09925 [Marixanthomonas ophiurae]